MNKLTRKQASTIFKARTRMVPVKNNYRKMYHNNICRACGHEVETQQHVFEECDVLHLVGDYKVRWDDIFSDEVGTLKEVSVRITNILTRVEEDPKN